MEYSIGEVAKMFNLNESTIRYYDQMGIIPGIKKRSGIRIFEEGQIEALRIIECLKKSGLKIGDIKKYFDLCKNGKDTYQQRYDLFLTQKENVLGEIERLKEVIKVLDFKLWYYETLMDGVGEDEIINTKEYLEFRNQKK